MYCDVLQTFVGQKVYWLRGGGWQVIEILKWGGGMVVTSDWNIEVAEHSYAPHCSLIILRKDHGFLQVSQNYTWGDYIKKRVGAENKFFNEFKSGWLLQNSY